MIVRDIMSKAVATCRPESDLGSVAETMKERDCGFLPVIDSHGTIVGVVTDRDVCLAGAAKNRPLGRVSVKDAMSHPVYSCFLDENLTAVLATMAKHRVRRLPVLNKNGHLEGVLSIDDIVQTHGPGGPTADEIIAALKGVYTERTVEAASA